MRITEEYVMEKIEAYNVAITALELQESSDNWRLAKRLRMSLRNKLDREIQRWCDKNMHRVKEGK